MIQLDRLRFLLIFMSSLILFKSFLKEKRSFSIGSNFSSIISRTFPSFSPDVVPPTMSGETMSGLSPSFRIASSSEFTFPIEAGSSFTPSEFFCSTEESCTVC